MFPTQDELKTTFSLSRGYNSHHMTACERNWKALRNEGFLKRAWSDQIYNELTALDDSTGKSLNQLAIMILYDNNHKVAAP